MSQSSADSSGSWCRRLRHRVAPVHADGSLWAAAIAYGGQRMGQRRRGRGHPGAGDGSAGDSTETAHSRRTSATRSDAATCRPRSARGCRPVERRDGSRSRCERWPAGVAGDVTHRGMTALLAALTHGHWGSPTGLERWGASVRCTARRRRCPLHLVAGRIRSRSRA